MYYAEHRCLLNSGSVDNPTSDTATYASLKESVLSRVQTVKAQNWGSWRTSGSYWVYPPEWKDRGLAVTKPHWRRPGIETQILGNHIEKLRNRWNRGDGKKSRIGEARKPADYWFPNIL